MMTYVSLYAYVIQSILEKCAHNSVTIDNKLNIELIQFQCHKRTQFSFCRQYVTRSVQQALNKISNNLAVMTMKTHDSLRRLVILYVRNCMGQI